MKERVTIYTPSEYINYQTGEDTVKSISVIDNGVKILFEDGTYSIFAGMPFEYHSITGA